MSQWSTHYTTLYPHINLQDRDTLELVARVKFKFYPGCPAKGPSYASGGHPGDGPDVDAIEVVSLEMDFGGGKTEPLPLTKGLCDWIADTIDRDTLAESAAEDRAIERDGAVDAKYQAMRDERIGA